MKRGAFWRKKGQILIFINQNTGQNGSNRQKTEESALQSRRRLIRLRLTDEASKMDDVSQLKFYYLGGSSTFSPSAGYGCVNSKQTEYRAFSDDGVYCLYTLPHADNGVLTKMTVTALDASDNALWEIIIEDVPVAVNKITDCTGNVRGGSGSVTATITVDADWGGVSYYNY